jgi:hypothetical protein
VAAVAALLATAPAAVAGDGIVGGTPASPGAYPAQGAFRMQTSLGQGFCGGTLVAPTLFLTAAHCVDDLGETVPPQDMSVYMGDVDLQPPNPAENFFGVVAVDRHGAYDPDTFQNDLAMLTLARPAPFQPLRVIRPEESAKWAPGTSARIIGWGLTDPQDQQSASAILLEADVPIRSDAQCAADYPGAPFEPAFDAATMVCAAPELGGVDTCQGDSGGPLMVSDGPALVLVGVTSWGTGCAEADHPGVYVRLGAPALNTWVGGARPQASFTASAALVGAATTFTATSTTPEGSFSVFNWDLDGDGAFDDATGGTAARVYPAPGPVTVGLESIQPGGDHALATQTIVVNTLPTAVAGGAAGYSVREGSSVQLTGQGTDPDGQALSYSWDLNRDGAFEIMGQTTTFSALGLDGPTTRTATLQVCDSAGGCTTSSTTIQVRNAAPRANAGRDRRARRGRVVRFFVRATDPGGDALRATWRIAGRTKRGARVSYRFRRAGLYVVRVTVTDGDGGSTTDRVRVRVRR